MKAIIEVDVPDYQIGQEVSIHFKDTMMIKGIVQEPKTGHWIDMTSGYAFNDKCSECGYIVHIQFIKEYQFCPNCGARMVGDNNEID